MAINDYNRYDSIPVFDYSSPFTYKRVRDVDDDDYDSEVSTRDGLFQRSIYMFIIIITVLFLILTFPIAAFFCVRRIPSLKRCLIYRLGRRLPLKGPGFILLLPFIDKISIIDLYESRFDLIENEQQFMTGDGSIIVVKPCHATLNVTDALLTTLKINNVNVKNFLQISFTNLIRSKHVEDLENKLDFILKEFEEKMNQFMKRWGYAITMIEQPRITVIDRADPINPIKKKLQKLLDNDPSEQSSNPQSSGDFSCLFNMFDNLQQSSLINDQSPQTVSDETMDKSSSLMEYQLIAVVQTFFDQYKTFLGTDKNFNVKLMIEDNDKPMVKYFHCQQDGNVRLIENEPIELNMTVKFKNQADFHRFLTTRDHKYFNFKIH
ncbi:hypothetical protein DERF_007641 [Dermatophagoides farinae]|uniref:Spfh domain containing protein 1 n=1 Tax=Dermatophagoides farinae TaxID=6954 RepID=A0A922L3D6_DERFA|nr:stomatin-like protein 3 [Dermatophagoides farinae]KAH7646467.1 spfh domain containing protein 1 [Dermatophagoides farinae]KAH9516928.1 hypothetical protein DERF_007641 [Dermatophagoides farinae]